MKVLIVGGGGREHAIAMAVKKSKRVSKIYCNPGNAGIAAVAECNNIGVMDFDADINGNLTSMQTVNGPIKFIVHNFLRWY